MDTFDGDCVKVHVTRYYGGPSFPMTFRNLMSVVQALNLNVQIRNDTVSVMALHYDPRDQLCDHTYRVSSTAVKTA